MTEQVSPYDFSPSPSVGLGACGRAPSHPEEVDTLLGREPNRAVELAVDYLALRDLVSEQASAILECKRRLASIPVTVATADLAYVSSMLGFIAMRLDVAVAS